MRIYGAAGAVLWDSRTNRTLRLGTAYWYRIHSSVTNRWICEGPVTSGPNAPPTALRMNTVTLQPDQTLNCRMSLHLDGAIRTVTYP